MNKIYIELTLDGFGNVTETKVVSRQKIREQNMGSKLFVSTRDDEGDDVKLLRRMIAHVGGPVLLAAMMGVSRSNIYQFVYRNKVSKKARKKLYKLVEEGGLTFETE